MHTLIISFLVGLSSYFIYLTACNLVDQLPPGEGEGGVFFRERLAAVLWVVIPVVIAIGGFFHYYFSKKITMPLRQLGDSLEKLKAGKYEEEVRVTAFNEVGILSGHINELRERLKRNDEGRSKMLSDMAHDLRTPLSNISGYFEAMRDGVIKGDADLYASLHKESQRLIDMVEEVQEMSRWNEQTSEILQQKKEEDLKALLEEAGDLFRLKFADKQIPFDVTAEPYRTVIHKEGIQKAVINLLQNAYQYYEGTASVRLSGKAGSSYYEIILKTPGPALTDEDRQSMFDRFYRADSSRARSSGGTGLGLAIVKNIIEDQHYGKVEVTSEDKVHTFRIQLPDEKDGKVHGNKGGLS